MTISCHCAPSSRAVRNSRAGPHHPTATTGGRAEAHQREWIVLIPLCYLILHSPSSHTDRNSLAGSPPPTATAGGRAEAHQREWIVLIPLCYLILHSPSSHADRNSLDGSPPPNRYSRGQGRVPPMWVNCFDTFMLLDFTFYISCRQKQWRRPSLSNRYSRGQGRGPPMWVNCFDTSVLLDITFSIISYRPKQSRRLSPPQPLQQGAGQKPTNVSELFWYLCVTWFYILHLLMETETVSPALPPQPLQQGAGQRPTNVSELFWYLCVTWFYILHLMQTETVSPALPHPTATAGGRAEDYQCEWIVLIHLCYLILHFTSHAVRNSRAGPRPQPLQHWAEQRPTNVSELFWYLCVTWFYVLHLLMHSETVAPALTTQPLQQGAGQRPTNVSELFWYLCVTWFYILHLMQTETVSPALPHPTATAGGRAEDCQCEWIVLIPLCYLILHFTSHAVRNSRAGPRPQPLQHWAEQRPTNVSELFWYLCVTWFYILHLLMQTETVSPATPPPQPLQQEAGQRPTNVSELFWYLYVSWFYILHLLM